MNNFYRRRMAFIMVAAYVKPAQTYSFLTGGTKGGKEK
jgi:hypothetical protein